MDDRRDGRSGGLLTDGVRDLGRLPESGRSREGECEVGADAHGSLVVLRAVPRRPEREAEDGSGDRRCQEHHRRAGVRAPSRLLGRQRQDEGARAGPHACRAVQQHGHEAYAQHGQRREAQDGREREDDVVGTARGVRSAAQLPPGESGGGHQHQVQAVAHECATARRGVGRTAGAQGGRHERAGEQDGGGQHREHESPRHAGSLLQPGGLEVDEVGQPRVHEARGRYGDGGGHDRQQQGLDGHRAELLAATQSHPDQEVPLVLADRADESTGEECGSEGQGGAEEQDHQDGGTGARLLGVDALERAGEVGGQPGDAGAVADPCRQESGRVAEGPHRGPQGGVLRQREGRVRRDAKAGDRRTGGDERALSDHEGAVGRRGGLAVAVVGGEARPGQGVALPLDPRAGTEGADDHERQRVVDAPEAGLPTERHLVAEVEAEQASGRLRHHRLERPLGLVGGPPARGQVGSRGQAVGRHQVALAVLVAAARVELPQPGGDRGLERGPHRRQHVCDHPAGVLPGRGDVAALQLDEEGRDAHVGRSGILDRHVEGAVLGDPQHQRAGADEGAGRGDEQDDGAQQPALHERSPQDQGQHGCTLSRRPGRPRSRGPGRRGT